MLKTSRTNSSISSKSSDRSRDKLSILTYKYYKKTILRDKHLFFFGKVPKKLTQELNVLKILIQKLDPNYFLNDKSQFKIAEEDISSKHPESNKISQMSCISDNKHSSPKLSVQNDEKITANTQINQQKSNKKEAPKIVHFVISEALLLELNNTKDSLPGKLNSFKKSELNSNVRQQNLPKMPAKQKWSCFRGPTSYEQHIYGYKHPIRIKQTWYEKLRNLFKF